MRLKHTDSTSPASQAKQAFCQRTAPMAAAHRLQSGIVHGGGGEPEEEVEAVAAEEAERAESEMRRQPRNVRQETEVEPEMRRQADAAQNARRQADAAQNARREADAAQIASLEGEVREARGGWRPLLHWDDLVEF
jgi:hypothetical protein